MMEGNFASRLSEAFQATASDPLCEIDTATRSYVQSRGRENGFVEYFRLCRRNPPIVHRTVVARDSRADEVSTEDKITFPDIPLPFR